MGLLLVLQERGDDLEPLERAGLASGPCRCAMVSRSCSASASRSKLSQALLDRLGAHAAPEVVAEAVLHLAVEHLVAHRGLGPAAFLKRVQTSSSRSSSRCARSRICFISRSAPSRTLRRDVGLGALGLELGEVRPRASWRGRRRRRRGASRAARARAPILSSSEGRSRCRGLLVDRGDHVGGEVDDLLEVLRRQVEQVAQPARHTLEVPDVGDRGGELDVAHALAAHLGAGDLDAAALADDALEADPLVLAAVALPVPGGTEDLLAEEPVLLGLEGAVVDGLRLLDLAVATTGGCPRRSPDRCAARRRS